MSSAFEFQEEPGPLNTVYTGLAVVLWLVVSHYAFFSRQLDQIGFVREYLPFLGPYPEAQFGILFLGLALILFIVNELDKEIPDENWPSVALLSVSGVIVAATCAYMFINFRAIYGIRVGTALPIEYTIATFFLVAMVYLVYRSFGLIFTFIVLGGIAYGMFGQFAPGILWHTGLSFNRILLTLVMDIEGFFGFLTRVVATWVSLFLLFAGLLKGFGAFDLIFRLAIRTGKYIESGVAQTAVIASAIIGSVNGSQTANTGMTGAFTIPLMQRNGIKGATAGGIESTASTLGQVLPPVMGAAAFIMASLLGISYIDVLIAGVIPALILLIATAVAVHFIASPQIKPIDMTETDRTSLGRGKLLWEFLRYGIPLFVLLWLLGVWQWRVMTAAFWTVVAMIITGAIFPLIEDLWQTRDLETVRTSVAESTNDTIIGAREGAVIVAPVTIILAAINGVADIFSVTGVPGTISLALIDLSGGVLVIAVILTMLICIILGLGMPTTASYTLVAILIAPTLTGPTFDLPPLSAHYFVFYAALLAGLTPPIATCPAVACGIAGANFWRTCEQALKVAAPIFIIPFSFIYHPELVSAEFNLATGRVALMTLAGAVILVYGINGPRGYPDLFEYSIRGVYSVIGVFVMVWPSFPLQLGAVALMATMFVIQKRVLDVHFFDRTPEIETAPDD